MKLSHKHIKIFLLILTVLAAIKMLLQNFSLDEEYQVLMSYRLLMGDKMLDTMWEPHQTSSFLCTLFMWPYFFITGTFTGVVIYLRIMGTLIHLGVACYLYKVLKLFLKEETCFYLALIFFNTIPKLIMLPEFGGMQVWFGLLCFLAIIESAESGKSFFRLVLAGLFLCLEVLSYPSCALLWIPFVIMIWTCHSSEKLKKCFVFTGTCAAGAIAFLGFFLIKVGPEVLLRNIPAILTSDLTHTFDTGSRLTLLFQNLLHYAISFGVITAMAVLLSFLPWFKKHLPEQKGIAITGLVILLSNVYQLVLWVVFNKGYEYLQIHLAVTMCLGLWSLLLCPKKPDQDCSTAEQTSSFPRYMWFGAVIGLASLACIMLLTDLDLLSSIPHGMLGSICMLALFAYRMEKHSDFIYWILVVCCLTACVGKGYTLRGGFGDYNNVLQSQGICKDGPAIGTISTYMGAYIYNNEYALWQDHIPQGSNVLIATSNVQSVNTIQYAFSNARVCHYSIVDPTAYDQRLLTYWSYYPDKEPDIIVIDCWFGNMLFDEDYWIVKYIEEDFGYTQVIEGDYVRIYKK